MNIATQLLHTFETYQSNTAIHDDLGSFSCQELANGITKQAVFLQKKFTKKVSKMVVDDLLLPTIGDL